MPHHTHILLPIVTSEDGTRCADECAHYDARDRWCRQYKRNVHFKRRHDACLTAERAAKEADGLTLSRDDVEQILLWAIDKDSRHGSEAAMRRLHAFANGEGTFDAWIDAACDAYDAPPQDGGARGLDHVEQVVHVEPGSLDDMARRFDAALEQALNDPECQRLVKLAAPHLANEEELRTTLAERDATIARLREREARVRALCVGLGYDAAYDLERDVLSVLDEKDGEG